MEVKVEQHDSEKKHHSAYEDAKKRSHMPVETQCLFVASMEAKLNSASLSGNQVGRWGACVVGILLIGDSIAIDHSLSVGLRILNLGLTRTCLIV